MNDKKISVAMASYNGIKYLGEQLDSIRTQTLKPDEVIICDDCSNDGTFEFCSDYIAKYNLTGWTVYRNNKNLGVLQNFRLALSKCTGDYIFTSDQDDIWMPEKIQVMAQAMNENQNIMLLVSNYQAIDSNKQKINAHLKNNTRNDGEIIRLPLKNYWLENVRPGCVMAFRREILERLKIFDLADKLHDSILWQHAIIIDSLYLINRQLILYRRHENNATAAFHPALSLERKIKDLGRDLELYKNFLAHSKELGINNTNRELLKKKINFLTQRINILAKKNLFAIKYFVIVNIKFYPTLRNALSDIYAAIFIRN